MVPAASPNATGRTAVNCADERFHFLGNTSARGATLALLNRDYRQRVTAAADMMTYLELSADNSFYDNFMSALFLPHTEIERFPSVAAVIR